MRKITAHCIVCDAEVTRVEYFTYTPDLFECWECEIDLMFNQVLVRIV